MGLVSIEVEITLTNNVKYYENLGYEIPKHKNVNGRITTPKGTKIKVKIEDLPKNSHVEVTCKCDGCGKELIIPYREYNRFNRNGNIYCKSCSHTTNISMNKEGQSLKSFEQWCIDNNRQDILDRWDYELNNCNPNEIIFKTGKKYYFKCPCGKHDSDLRQINSFTKKANKNMDCIGCCSFAQWGIDTYGENFLKNYWDYDKNSLNPYKIKKACNKKVWIKCQEKDYHGSYEITCNNFVCGGYRCPYCNCKNGKVHTKDSLGQYIIDNYGKDFLKSIWSKKNIKSSFEYSCHSMQKAWWKCSDNLHGDFERIISSSFNRGFYCPICSRNRKESYLQEKVRLYLESLEYTILHEEKCTITPRNPKTNRYLPFDNEIKELKLIIEVHGIQHYKISNIHNLSAKRFDTTPEYELHYIQLKDRYKRIKAKQQGYDFLEIPYWTDNKNEDWKILIDNKIKEILRK